MGGHHHHHHHHHHHGCSGNDYGRRFAIGVLLNGVFVAIECIYGFAANSMALLADAGHNLSDVLGLLLAWGAHRLATTRPTRKFTYGLRSSTILAAFGNGMLLLVAVGGIVWESAQRFAQPEATAGTTVMVVAAIGVVINLATAFLFFHGRHDDLNVRGAFLHMAADAAVSLGVVIAGFIVLKTGLAWIDPTIGILIAVVILFSTWELLKDSIALLLHAVPRNVDAEKVHQLISEQPKIVSIHDLHIWAMSTTENALTAHVVVTEDQPIGELAIDLEKQLHDKFGIHHSTIQVESESISKSCQQLQTDSV